MVSSQYDQYGHLTSGILQQVVCSHTYSVLAFCFITLYFSCFSSFSTILELQFEFLLRIMTISQTQWISDELLWELLLLSQRAPAEVLFLPGGTSRAARLWLGPYGFFCLFLRRSSGFSSGPAVGRHLCFQAVLQRSSCRAYIPLEYYETDLISQARCRQRYGSFVLFILA